MDSNPSFSLSFLYQSDPIYSLYASDLMTASKTVNNNFIKEQKQLLKTLQRLEQQQLIRRRQLSEEQRTFAFIMTKRLGQRGARPHTDPSYSTTTSAFSALPLRMPQSAPAALATHTTGSDTFGSAKGANSRETKFKVETSSNLQLED